MPLKQGMESGHSLRILREAKEGLASVPDCLALQVGLGVHGLPTVLADPAGVGGIGAQAVEVKHGPDLLAVASASLHGWDRWGSGCGHGGGVGLVMRKRFAPVAGQ